jgi:tRNA-dihydrouridine synthase
MIRRSQDCDALMIGRLAVRKPWIFAQARALEQGNGSNLEANRDIEETGLKFLELLAKYQPPEFHISRARRFFSYFCDNLKWGNYLKTQLNREPDLAGIEQIWRKYFKEMRNEELGILIPHS